MDFVWVASVGFLLVGWFLRWDDLADLKLKLWSLAGDYARLRQDIIESRGASIHEFNTGNLL
jgi:hypothetical protein